MIILSDYELRLDLVGNNPACVLCWASGYGVSCFACSVSGRHVWSNLSCQNLLVSEEYGLCIFILLKFVVCLLLDIRSGILP